MRGCAMRRLLQHEGDLACWQGAPVAGAGPVLVTRADALDEQERYFAMRSEATARRHHVAVDAGALRDALVRTCRLAGASIAGNKWLEGHSSGAPGHNWGHVRRVWERFGAKMERASGAMLEAQKSPEKRVFQAFLVFRVGRGDRIRTCDFYVPNVALYQAELHPVGSRVS